MRRLKKKHRIWLEKTCLPTLYLFNFSCGKLHCEHSAGLFSFPCSQRADCQVYGGRAFVLSKANVSEPTNVWEVVREILFTTRRGCICEKERVCFLIEPYFIATIRRFLLSSLGWSISYIREVNMSKISVICCHSLGMESGHIFSKFMYLFFIFQSDYNVQPSLRISLWFSWYSV